MEQLELFDQQYEFTKIAEDLVNAAAQLNKQIRILRNNASQLAGCSLFEWDEETLFKYVDLAEKYAKENNLV